jgi:molecular chaperone DnaK
MDNRTLGRFQLTDLPPAPRGIPQIEVSFDIDANGIISVTAKDKATDKQQNIKIESGSSLSDEEIERMRQEALENEESDNQKKQEVEKLNMVDSTIFQTEKQISEFDDKLTEEDRESLTAKLEELKKVYEEKDFENMDDSLQSLNETWAGISTRLYQETSSDETEDVDDVETTDVEVEEVKE